MRRLRTILEWVVAVPIIFVLACRRDPIDRELDRWDREEVRALKDLQRRRREWQPW